MSKDESFEFFVSLSSLLVVILYNLVLLACIFKSMCNAHTATNQVFKSQTLKLSVEMMGEHLKTHIYIPKKRSIGGRAKKGEQKRKAANDADRDKCKELLSDGSRPFFCPV